MTVGLLVERAREEMGTRTTSLGVSVEAAVPVLDTNEDAVRAARAEVRRREAVLRDAETRLAADLCEARSRIAAAESRIGILENGILPARERELALARATFAAGRTDRRETLRIRALLSEDRADLIAERWERAERILDALALLGTLGVENGEE